MDRETLLKKIGLSDDDLRDLIVKFTSFEKQLNPAQLAVLKRSLPSLERARASFGPTAGELRALISETGIAHDHMTLYVTGQQEPTNGDGDVN